jgi:hypothetical protein
MSLVDAIICAALEVRKTTAIYMVRAYAKNLALEMLRSHR